ncbi:exopolysaccharide biosynthesis protein [Anaerobacterium chartisolvens]|uniref:Exopolysaccharide biosynthesis protein n=1 Tax=Anaerobacterium chartisolvens TaxID=1297424 RepID=A0A369AKT1_9FIRM|nr:phosphodiester glycosidase family protein [Anaerobacterium chartisolvens]RCX08896.1 exopolysaccharide biosynthesis protein [Anaerobacterium chartisolvens]
MNRTEAIREVRLQKRKSFAASVRKFLAAFFIMFTILCLLTAGFLFYGPDTRLKELFVTTAMNTMSHQYLARLLVSDAEIASIMEKYRIIDPTEDTNQDEISLPLEGDDSIDGIKKIDIKGPTYKGYLLIVKDPSRVSLATTPQLGVRGTKVEDIVKSNNAVAGINAGGFADLDGHGTGGIPEGIIIEDGKILYSDNASSHYIIGFNEKNILVLGKYGKARIESLKIRDAVSFRPFLIVNGKPTITKGDGGWGIAPRTAIGQRTDGAVLLLTIDGRQISSVGATLKDVQDIMVEYGAHNAANLDGGSSTTLVYDGRLINSPSSQHGPRYVPSAFIVR